LTVATVRVVEDEDEDWLDGAQAANTAARSKAILAVIAIARAVPFIANFSLLNASMQ